MPPPAQRDLILAALGLRPRNGRMPRWSYRNVCIVGGGRSAAWEEMVTARWAERGRDEPGDTLVFYHVTRAVAEAAGVLGRCRLEDVER